MKLSVDPLELHKAASTFNQLASDYSSIYNRLINTASTMGEAWSAADNLAYVEQIKGLCDDLRAMTQHLETAASALEQQAGNYESTRDNNITGVKQLAN